MVVLPSSDIHLPSPNGIVGNPWRPWTGSERWGGSFQSRAQASLAYRRNKVACQDNNNASYVNVLWACISVKMWAYTHENTHLHCTCSPQLSGRRTWSHLHPAKPIVSHSESLVCLYSHPLVVFDWIMRLKRFTSLEEGHTVWLKWE